MTYEEFKKRACEVEEAIVSKGYDPKALWRLLRVLQGDVTPTDTELQYEYHYYKNTPRKYLVVKPHVPLQKHIPRGTDHRGNCSDCGAPLPFSGVCRSCGADNYWNVRLGVSKRKDKQ